MNGNDDSRRGFLKNATLLAGCSVLLNACGNNGASSANGQKSAAKGAEDKDKEEDTKEVTAAEDLMREHGVLRRALIVYSEAANRLRQNPGDMPPDALAKTAQLFRTFGEEYHENKLEEGFIFPVLKQKGGEAASLPDILVVQHKRGREITDYIISVSNAAKLGANATNLADALTAFVRMYETHAAREDTIVFPAWKDAISDDQYKEFNEKFEDIEHEQFGEDGFEDAVKQIGEIENTLKIWDISQFTAPAPPAMK
jgi:hemerythrin-like domain-containing protein